MCGRFALVGTIEKISTFFTIQNTVEFVERYNIAPGQDIFCIKEAEEGRQLSPMHWGLIPSWAKDKKLSYKLINARIESIETKPMFRSAVKKRRCIIPASGYFEWRLENKVKQPYYLFPKTDPYFGFAGIWEEWCEPETKHMIQSCCIITEAAKSKIKPVHDRKPVILNPEFFSTWLDLSMPVTEALSDGAILSEKEIDYGKVSIAVNNARNISSECIRFV